MAGSSVSARATASPRPVRLLPMQRAVSQSRNDMPVTGPNGQMLGTVSQLFADARGYVEYAFVD